MSHSLVSKTFSSENDSSSSTFTSAFLDSASPQQPLQPQPLQEPSTIRNNLFVGTADDVMTKVRYRPVETQETSFYQASSGSLSHDGHDNGVHSTEGQNIQKPRCKHWVTRSSVRSFARLLETAHSFACFGLLALLAPSAALTRSLARSLRSLPRSWDSE